MNLTRLFVFYKTPSSHTTWKQCHNRFYRIGRAQEQSRNFARKLGWILHYIFSQKAVADPGEAPAPLFLDQTEARRAPALCHCVHTFLSFLVEVQTNAGYIRAKNAK